ncbi:unnamed protein product [Mucor fragilis]
MVGLEVCQRRITDLQREIEDLHVKLMKESQGAFSYSNSVKESDILMDHETTDSKKRSSNCLDLEKQTKEIDDMFSSGEYFNTLRDFMINAEEKIPSMSRPVDWDEVFPKQK